jgi:hypothetical protein
VAPHPVARRVRILLQTAKHKAFVSLKPARWRWYEATEPIVRALHRIRPLRFDAADFEGTFVVASSEPPRRADEPVPRRVFVFWTGDNPMSRNRLESLAEMRAMLEGVDVLLLTSGDIADWEVPDEPFHPLIEHLSYIHRADYYRAYFLHHHGGGYADLKRPTHGWSAVFDRMDSSTAWLAGYRVPVRLMTPNMDDPHLERLMRRWSDRRLGQSAYLARPRTPLTREWLAEVERRISAREEALRRNPGDARGSNPGYPVPFNSILAQVLDPLQVKYNEHLLYDPRLMMEHDNYR